MEFFTINFILTFDVRIIVTNVALINLSVYCTASKRESLLVELFGEPAMDKYNHIGNTHPPALCSGIAPDENNELGPKC